VPKAICAVPLRKALTLRRGQRPHHARKEQIGTWEISRLTGRPLGCPARVGKARIRFRRLLGLLGHEDPFHITGEGPDNWPGYPAGLSASRCKASVWSMIETLA
jgi:hypothetical protein